MTDYSLLKPAPDLEGESWTYVNPDKMKDLHQYVAIIVDPVTTIVASDADLSQVPDDGRKALAAYFRHAIRQAVSDAFVEVDEPGPLTLRLRASVVGVDAGGEVVAADLPEDATALQRAINISDVYIEAELVDSVSGDVIAEAVDKTDLGEGAEVGAVRFSRVERYSLAKEAFDEWAGRLRDFLDMAYELKGEDLDRAIESYHPY